jgi:protein dithiol oxidoreductase (disulfide-forming)
MIKRRDFHSMTLAGAAALGGVAAVPSVRAQGVIEGANYTRLPQPAPVLTNANKVEVLEFFMYSCPHCNALEPVIEPWIKHLPADVDFRRMPLAFRPNLEVHQRLYFALEALGLLGTMHAKVFAAMHVEHKALGSDEEVAALMKANGVDGAKVVATMKSFSVIGKARQARQLAEAYRIDGVPTIGVQGRWTTSSSQAGSHERLLVVVDYLIDQARKSLHA